MRSPALVTACLIFAILGCSHDSAAPPRPTISTTEPTTTDNPPSITTITALPTTTTTTTTQTPPVPSTTRPPLGSLSGTDWERIPTNEHVVALTFDAGANDAGLASILRTLADEQIPATFFLTGSFADSFPESARAMAHYRIGNHSMSHPSFTSLTDDQLRNEVDSAADRIRAVTGQDPAPWFRFPFGDRDGHAIETVNSLGYVPVRWTVDTLGWKGTSGAQSVNTVEQRVLGTLTDGQIVLMHIGSNPNDGTTLDADALPAIIHWIRDRGYSFVTLDAFLVNR